MITVICVYTNKRLLEECLLSTVNNQSVRFDLQLVDNTQGTYQSAAQALNAAADKAGGDYLMFVHQDVSLASASWLEDAERCLAPLHNVGIAGVAGARRDPASGVREIVTNITQGPTPRKAGYLPVPEPQQVETLDECLVLIPRSVFNDLRFDESTCPDWHLYTVDYCLSAAQMGLAAWVLPIPAHHHYVRLPNRSLMRTIRTLGAYPPGYYLTLDRLIRKHRRETDIICTTTGCWKTSGSIRRQIAVQQAQTFSMGLIGHLVFPFLRDPSKSRLVRFGRRMLGFR